MPTLEGAIHNLRVFDNPYWGGGTKVCPACGGAENFNWRKGLWDEWPVRRYTVLNVYMHYDEWACTDCHLIGVTAYDNPFVAKLTLACEVGDDENSGKA